MYIINDNELLYLIKENDDSARELLITKYEPLILANIKKIKFEYIPNEDVYQEGMLTLIKAINSFNEEYLMSFNAYFSLLLNRKIIDLIRRDRKLANIKVSGTMDEYVIDSATILKEDCTIEEIYEKNIFSKLEDQVYKYKFFENLKPKEIAKKMGINVKIVYDALRRIKIKIK